MTKDETLALYAQGKEAWNDWAGKRLAERAQLETAGQWVSELEFSCDSLSNEEATKQWLDDARADFTAYGFSSDATFTEFLFPGEAAFKGATFGCKANFDGTVFKHFAQFRGALFQGTSTSFQGAIFEHIAHFSDTKFHQEARFAGTTFNGYVLFENVQFSGYSDFSNVRFADTASFKNTGFSKVRFQHSSFTNDAEFSRTRFNGEANFVHVVFESKATFRTASFKNEAFFNEAKFNGFATFALVVFKEFTYFMDATFTAGTSFVGMKGESFFTMRSAKFNLLPDFAQAHFNEAPRLDESIFNNTPKLSAEYPSRWRALKRLAIQAHDHEREQMFFAEEIKSLRGVEDFPLPTPNHGRATWSGSGRYWAGFIYEWISDFGRSIRRPIMGWCLVAVLCGAFFLHYHLRSGNPATTLYHWASGTHKATHFAELSCLNSPRHLGDQDNPVAAAVYLSIHNGVVFSGLGRSDKLVQSYACLYGGNETSSTIPNLIVFIGFIQTLVSAVLIFLLGLALRNKFRIR